ncbi:MAG TPA: RagB/SusD family nutrient uptake outer membrane protein [Prolixibacteraceae bacterium]|nr:RagB/SusD family nutrient uptake outer membrane protein [Prolixibacteraceae bacterium]
MKKNSILLLIWVWVFAACDDILSPADENLRTLEDIYDDPSFAEGILLNAYTRLPTNYYSYSEVATDDAVTNNKTNDYLRAATGQWSAIFNPLSQWDNSYTAIMYLNKFLEETDKVTWSFTSDTANVLFNNRHKGEAHGLRALYMLYLLQHHGGYGPDGTLLGVPIVTESMDANSEFPKTRNTFEECMQQIYRDLNAAEDFLPVDYEDVEEDQSPPDPYANYTPEQYNRVFGAVNKLRVSGRIVKAIRAKAALLAASDAYRDGTSTTWEDAARYAGEIINLYGGLSSIDDKGHIFYKSAQVKRINLSKGYDSDEMLWRGSLEGTGSTGREEDNYPPTLFGNGRVNPTQNLVDAFPMANGYPIDHPSSGYDPNNPYKNRDPRLGEYILLNGSSFGGKTISVAQGSGHDAVNAIKTSTRTGYYLKKLLREDVKLDPAATQAQQHYAVHIRYTEIFLIYAEAANEAWGPDAKGSYGISAREVMAALRSRAGIKQPDSYLDSVTSKEDMRKLIRNERRLELCFEGFRFWDLRRWKVNLTEPARGIKIDGSTLSVSNVEDRIYSDYMYYGPLPYNEVLKSDLVQNAGW